MTAIIWPFSQTIIILNNVHVILFPLVISICFVKSQKLNMIKQSTSKDLLHREIFLNLDHLLIFGTGARLFLIGKTPLCVIFINS